MKMKFTPPKSTARLLVRTMTLQEFYSLHDDFIRDKTLKGLASRTISDHKKHMKYFKTYACGEYQPHDRIEKNMFKNYIHYMIDNKHLKPCTINLRLRTLKCFLNWLFINSHIQENISPSLSLVKVPQDTIQPLTKVEIRKMLDSCNLKTYSGFRDFVIMLVILDTGIRINELCETKLGDIDTKNMLLRIRAEVSKTRIERPLPLSKHTASLLCQLIDIAKENSCQYVFNSGNGTKVIPEYIIRNFERYGERVKLGKRCTPHVWRHTFAVEAVKRGMDVFTLQRILGHTNIQTTRQYVQLQIFDIQKKHADINILNSLLE